MRSLPYLNGVRAFEAAARLGSFAGAGGELHVSAAAVSRMVRLLEDRLGVELFARGANRLALTPAGEAYRTGLTPILDALALLTEQVRARPGPRTLTVGVGPTFAIRWLIPRLADFRAVAPDVDVRITTGGAAAEFAGDWTCGIRLGSGPWPGLVADRLFDARLLPVCSPRHAGGLRSPADLHAGNLLRVRHAPGDWPAWLAVAGAAGLGASGPMFDFYDQALKAAADGVGVALGLTPYVDDDLAAGRLVAPFRLAVPKGTHWHLIHAERRRGEPAFESFRDWLVSAARRTNGPADVGPGLRA